LSALVRTLIAALLLVSAAGATHADEVSPAIRAKAKARIKKARGAYEAGNLDLAVSEYQAAYKLLPVSDILFNIGQILRVKEARPAAIQSYRKYLEADPQGSHADEARANIAAITRELVPAEAQPSYDATKQTYEDYKRDKGPAFDEKWAALDEKIASGQTDGIGAQLDALRSEIKPEKRPPPRLDEETTKRAVASTVKKEKAPPRPLPPLLKKWWFWTAIGGGVAVIVVAAAVGATVGSNDKDPVASLGVLR
jgi:tetratricopeptide (TPR) repeat protein